MQIEIPDDHDVQAQAAAAGFATVADYVAMRIERDAERAAIQEGLNASKAGRVRPFEEFDREFRRENGLPPRS